jgi:hypothetical protein
MLAKIKQIHILSNGSITFSFSISFKNKPYVIFEKDNLNLKLSQKNTILKMKSDISQKYKNKYFK